MKLYYHPLSTYSQKVLIACYEKNITFEPIKVELMSPEGRAAYEAIYPIGKIPLLKPSDDYMVPESTIIIEYLEGHQHQGTRLIPEGVDAARQVRFMDRMGDLYLNNPMVTLLSQRLGFGEPSEAELAKARKYLRISFEQLDKRLGREDWVCGSFSMADCAVIPPLFYCQLVAPFADFRNLVRYYERARQRASYARVVREFMPIWESLEAQRQPKPHAA